ncbi:MAG: hypothetical protein SFU98_22890 [Leptospiraceae bacterium]|nr:hypothetical protein [Leptospiraceae bacterium]
MKRENNEGKLMEAYQIYIESGDSNELIKESGLWIQNFVIRTKILDEDEAADLFLKFLDKFEDCMKIFRERKYTSLAGFLGAYAKHLSMNMIRTKIKYKEDTNTEFISLWGLEASLQKDPKSVYSPSVVKFIRKNLKHLNPESRIIFCLRYNLSISEKDKLILKSILLKNNSDYNVLEKKIQDKNEEIKRREEQIIRRINFYNRQIFLKEQEQFSKEKKVALQKKLTSLKNGFTIKEISEYLKVSRSKVVRVCQEGIDLLKEQFQN